MEYVWSTYGPAREQRRSKTLSKRYQQAFTTVAGGDPSKPPREAGRQTV